MSRAGGSKKSDSQDRVEVFNRSREDALPESLSAEIHRYVLQRSRSNAWDRIDALARLLIEWVELYGADRPNQARDRWIKQHSGRPYVLYVTSKGNVKKRKNQNPQKGDLVVPKKLMRLLQSYVLDVEGHDVRANLQLSRLTGNWEELALDGEKLVGHLALGHDKEVDFEELRIKADVGLSGTDLVDKHFDRLWRLHANAHGIEPVSRISNR